MRKVYWVALALIMLAAPLATRPQVTEDAGQKNAKQARAALDAMVQALGGEAWLNQKNQMLEGRVAAFFHGKPSGGTTEYWEYHAWPDHGRIEFTKHRDMVQFYVGRAGTEVTYKGNAPLPQEQVDDFLRRRDHSIETVVKVWLKDPNTILIYKDKNIDADEYDDYHNLDGFPTPFTITRFKNDDMTRQYFVVHVKYNQELPADFWSVEAAEKRIKK